MNSNIKTKSQLKNNSATVFEYDFPTKNLSLAKAKINGRYPAKGIATNTKCEQIYYCLSGSAVIFTDQGQFEIKKDDSYYFKSRQKYFIEAKNLTVLIINSPKWTKKQYKYF